MPKIKITKTITETIDVHPCPFCGSEQIELRHEDKNFEGIPANTYVGCLSCGAKGGVVYDNLSGDPTHDAIKNWNKRVQEKEVYIYE